MVGDTGFEPVTSTVCKRHKFWSHFGHSCKIKDSKYKVLEIVPDITPDKVLLKHLPDTFFLMEVHRLRSMGRVQSSLWDFFCRRIELRR